MCILNTDLLLRMIAWDSEEIKYYNKDLNMSFREIILNPIEAINVIKEKNIDDETLLESYGLTKELLEEVAERVESIDSYWKMLGIKRVTEIEEEEESDGSIEAGQYTDVYNSMTIIKDTNGISIKPKDGLKIGSNNNIFINTIELNELTLYKYFPYLRNDLKRRYTPPQSIRISVSNIPDTKVYDSNGSIIKEIPVDYDLFNFLLHYTNDRIKEQVKNGGVLTAKIMFGSGDAISTRRPDKAITTLDTLLMNNNDKPDYVKDIYERIYYLSKQLHTTDILHPVKELHKQRFYKLYVEFSAVSKEELTANDSVMFTTDVAHYKMGMPTLPVQHHLEYIGNDNITPKIFTGTNIKYFTVIAGNVVEIPRVNFPGIEKALIPVYNGGSCSYREISPEEYKLHGIFTDVNEAREYYSIDSIQKRELELKHLELDVKKDNITREAIRSHIDLLKKRLDYLIVHEKYQGQKRDLEDKIRQLENELNQATTPSLQGTNMASSTLLGIATNFNKIITEAIKFFSVVSGI
jgi:hypothetical protein